MYTKYAFLTFGVHLLTCLKQILIQAFGDVTLTLMYSTHGVSNYENTGSGSVIYISINGMIL